MHFPFPCLQGAQHKNAKRGEVGTDCTLRPLYESNTFRVHHTRSPPPLQRALRGLDPAQPS